MPIRSEFYNFGPVVAEARLPYETVWNLSTIRARESGLDVTSRSGLLAFDLF